MNWYKSIQANGGMDDDHKDPRQLLEDLPEDLKKVAAEVGLMDIPQDGSEEFNDWAERVEDFTSMVLSGSKPMQEETPEYWGIKSSFKDLMGHDDPEPV